MEELKLKLFALELIIYNNEQREMHITALNKEEAIRMFAIWKKQRNKDYVEFTGKVRTIRKNKRNYRFFKEEFYKKELKLLGLEERR